LIIVEDIDTGAEIFFVVVLALVLAIVLEVAVEGEAIVFGSRAAMIAFLRRSAAVSRGLVLALVISLPFLM
jgi:hypothetical protein